MPRGRANLFCTFSTWPHGYVAPAVPREDPHKFQLRFSPSYYLLVVVKEPNEPPHVVPLQFDTEEELENLRADFNHQWEQMGRKVRTHISKWSDRVKEKKRKKDKKNE